MKINCVNYNNKTNFGSIKLANLNLQKTFSTGLPIKVTRELHELDASDLPMIKELQIYTVGRRPADMLTRVFCKDFIENITKTQNKMKFFAVMHNHKPQAICESVVNNNKLYIGNITNLNRDNGIKGAGTALMVQLVELAKKQKNESVYLSSLEDATAFYKKLGFREDTNYLPVYGILKLPAYCFSTFLNKFKSKYFA